MKVPPRRDQGLLRGHCVRNGWHGCVVDEELVSGRDRLSRFGDPAIGEGGIDQVTNHPREDAFTGTAIVVVALILVEAVD